MTCWWLLRCSALFTNCHLGHFHIELKQIAYLAKVINIFWSIDRTWSKKILWDWFWMNLICLVVLSAYSNIYSKMEGYETKLTWSTNERKWWQPQLDLTTEFCSRWEFGWLTVELWKMMPRIMFWSIYTCLEWQLHWTFPLSHITDLFSVFDACVVGFWLTGPTPLWFV